ncbi:hypothetical protein GCM10026982_50060 [Nocardiopsis aegyptia]
MSNGVRPVFDPDLPRPVAARLKKDPSSLLAENAPRRALKLQAAVITYGTAVAALNIAWVLTSGPLLTASPVWYFLGALTQAVVVAAAGLSAARALPRTWLPSWLRSARGHRWWAGFCLAALPATGLSWMLAFTGSTWAFTLGWHTPGVVYAIAALWVSWVWPRGERMATAHVHRYLLPTDFHGRGTDLLAGVQMVINAVEEAGRRLGGSFDTAAPLALLRTEEWRVARLVYQYQRLRAEHRADAGEAVSDRVRALLERQHEQQEASYRELSAHVDRLLEYGATVEDMLRAHTEWEQIQRAEERDDRIVDLLSRTSSDGADGDRIEHEALGARAARDVLDELIDRALASGSALLAAPAHEDT